MATALLDTSNTLLHAAKALNYADIPALQGVKDAVSKSFALVFLGCRVILPPFSLIKPGEGPGSERDTSSQMHVCGAVVVGPAAPGLSPQLACMHMPDAHKTSCLAPLSLDKTELQSSCMC